MKLLILSLILFAQIAIAQNVHFQMFEDAAEHQFDALDEIMLTKYQFVRIHDSEEKNQRVYTNNHSEKDLLMVITVIEVNKSCRNIVSAVVGKLRNLSHFKDHLSKSGFLYHGEKSLTSTIKLHHYVKENRGISITKEITDTGAYQILLTCK